MTDNRNEEDLALASVEKALGEPVACELSTQGQRLRTNLIVLSVISIAIVLGDLRIGLDSSILGMKIVGLDDALVRNGLFWIVIYLTCHFSWSSWDSFQEWRLRITGTRVAFFTTGKFAGRIEDYPNDPRQSTLYNWWKTEAIKIGHIGNKAKEMDEKLSTCEEGLKKLIQDPQDSTNLNNALRATAEAREKISVLTNGINETKSLLDSQRIPASLKRFDRCFHLFLKSQNLRWLLFDLLIPIILGLIAISLLGDYLHKLIFLVSKS